MTALSFAFPVPDSFQRKLDAVEAYRAIPFDQDVVDDLDIPVVVVLGKQSCAKSSLLEGITGIGLPRGDNLVTRGPVILRLRRDPTARTPFAIVSLDPNDHTSEKIFDLKGGVETSIREAWSDICVSETDLTDTPIFVTVFRMTGIPLTLVDAPGVAGHGDTAEARKGFLARSTEIARKQLINQRAIIVLVVPATERDFANSDAVTLALECDPKGERTLGVMTFMDEVQTEEMFQLVMRRIQSDQRADVKLPLGWTAVKCRSAKQRQDEMSPDIAETNYFQQDVFGKRVPESHRSLKTVVQRICAVQEPSLNHWIPIAQEHAERHLVDVTANLEAIESRTADALSLDSFRWEVTSSVQHLAGELTKLITAEDTDERHNMHVCARTHELFVKFKEDLLQDAKSFFEDRKPESAVAPQSSNAGTIGSGYQFMKNSITEVQGAHREVFLSPLADKRTVSQFLSLTLRKHTNALISGIKGILIKVLKTLWEECMSSFPKICHLLAPERVPILTRLIEEAKSPVFSLVDAEEKHNFTQMSDDLFANESKISTILLTAIRKSNPSTNTTEAHMKVILSEVKKQFPRRLDAALPALAPNDRVGMHLEIAHMYCLAVIERCADVIPLLLKAHLVCKAPQFFQQHMVQKMSEIGFQELFHTHTSDAEVLAQEQRVRELVTSLQTATAALAECSHSVAGRGGQGSSPQVLREKNMWEQPGVFPEELSTGVATWKEKQMNETGAVTFWEYPFRLACQKRY